jgi:hypothetical protein
MDGWMDGYVGITGLILWRIYPIATCGRPGSSSMMDADSLQGGSRLALSSA